MSVKALEKWDALSSEKPPRFEWINEAEARSQYETLVWEHDAHELWEGPSLAFSRIGTPRLRVTDPTFGVNILELGVLNFVSARLRRAFDLDSRTVRYRPVDTSRSVPAVQALDYAIFDVMPLGNPFDPARMLGEVRPVRQPDGSLKDEWVMDWANRMEKSPDVYFLDTFMPPAPLFRGIGTLWIFATDELAERVMRAGIDDVLFQDITGPLLPGQNRSRTLR